MNFHLKRRTIYFESSISPLFDELHCSPIVHMNRMEPIFQDLLFFHQEGPKNSQSILSLSSQGWNPLPGACSDLDIHNYFHFYIGIKLNNKSQVAEVSIELH